MNLSLETTEIILDQDSHGQIKSVESSTVGMPNDYLYSHGSASLPAEQLHVFGQIRRPHHDLHPMPVGPFFRSCVKEGMLLKS